MDGNWKIDQASALMIILNLSAATGNVSTCARLAGCQDVAHQLIGQISKALRMVLEAIPQDERREQETALLAACPAQP